MRRICQRCLPKLTAMQPKNWRAMPFGAAIRTNSFLADLRSPAATSSCATSGCELSAVRSTPAEVTRYSTLFRKRAGISRKARGLWSKPCLHSPNFLFRLDDTSNPKLKPYATASRLSYALWDSMPDAALMGAAARGELVTPAGTREDGPPHACGPSRAPGSRRVCIAMAALRSGSDHQPGPPPLSEIHPRNSRWP